MPILIPVLLARVLGLLLIVAPISLWLNQSLISSMMEEFKKNQALLWLSGLAAFLLGSFVISANNIWSWHFSLIITIIGWLAFLKGLWLMLFPKSLTNFISGFLRPWLINSILVIYFLLGLYLFYKGFFVLHF